MMSPHVMDEAATSEERIIGAALTLINERGLGGVTMSGIASRAGVARQTVYNHYRDVDGIVAAAITRHNQESIALLESALAVAIKPEEKLEQLVRHVTTVGAQAGHSFDVQYGLSADARATLSEYGELINRHLHQILEAGMAAGRFRSDIEPELDAVLVQHLLSGVAALAAQEPDTSLVAAAGTRTILAALEVSG